MVYSRVAPANRERQEELDTERAHLEAMKPFKKKLYYEKKRMVRLVCFIKHTFDFV